MSLIATHSYEEGVDGANVVSGANGVIAISGVVKYSAASKVHEAMGISVPAGGGIGYTAPSSGQYSIYWSGYTIGPGASLLSSIRTSANAFLLRLRMNTVTGKYEITDSVSALQDTSVASLNAVLPGRADIRYVYDSGAGTLTTTIRLYLGANISGSTPDETLGPVTTTAAAAPGRVYIGTTSTGWTTIGIDTFRIYDDVVTWPVAYVPPAPSVVYSMAGKIQQNSAQVAIRVSGLSSCRLAYTTHSDMTSRSFTSSQAPSSLGYVVWDLTGLIPNNKYYYQLMYTPDGGSETTVGGIGSFKVRPNSGGTNTLKIALGSACLTATTQADDAFQSIIDWDPHYLLHVGDAYFNGATHDAAGHRTKWEAQVATVDEWRNLLQAVALEYTNASHELNPDNVDTNTSNALAWNQFFADTIPHQTLVDTANPPGSKHRSWVDSRIRFIMLDLKNTNRSPGLNADGPSKTMLGAAQLAWLLSELSQPELLKVVISQEPWSKEPAVVSGAQDQWWSYANERQTIADYIVANNINVDFLHGDSRRLGIDVSHNDWGAFPTIVGTGLSQNAVGGFMNAYYDQTWPVSGSAAISVYMRLTYEWLDANTLRRTASGWDAVGNVERVNLATTWVRDVAPGLAFVFVNSGGTAVPVNVYQRNSSGDAIEIAGTNIAP